MICHDMIKATALRDSLNSFRFHCLDTSDAPPPLAMHTLRKVSDNLCANDYVMSLKHRIQSSQSKSWFLVTGPASLLFAEQEWNSHV